MALASIISDIKTPNNVSNKLRDYYKSGVYTVIGTQTASTGSWTGALHGVPALYTGLTIAYYLPYAGNGNATLNLTLDNGTTTGAISCYYNTGRMTTHYAAGTTILMTYYAAGDISISGTATTDNRWCAGADYNSDSDRNAMYIRYYNNVLAKTALTAEKLIVGDTDGYNVAAGGTQFNISFPILWTTAAVSAGASNYANMYIQTYDRNLTNVKSGFSSTANKAIYMPVTLSGNIATIDDTLLTDTLPNSDDGKVYIRLGKLGAQSTGANYFFFEPVHPMFWYKNGAIRQFAQDASTVNGHTVGKDVPSNAVFTDTKNTAGTDDTSSKIYLVGSLTQSAVNADGTARTYTDNEVSGVLQTKNAQATAVVAANTANSSTAGGLSLYGTDPTSYGIAFRSTTNSGKHGYVQGDWAQYHYMTGADNRGWVFNSAASTGVASISKTGQAVFNGSVTVGGNAANTSGCRLEFDTGVQALNFVFT